MSDFKPMLAAKANPAKLRFPLIVQPKLDGIRASVVNGKLLSRTLKEIPNREIFNALSFPEYEGLDGELIVGDPTAEDAYRRTSSYCMARDKTGEFWTYHVFDRWNDPDYTSARLVRLCLSESDGGIPPEAEICEWTTVLDVYDLERREESLLAAGYEGAILRDPDSLYKFGRASVTKGELLKLKRFEDSEAEILDSVEEMHNGNEAVTNALGRTERSTAKAGKTGKGTLGKLLVRDIHTGVEFGVGSGFNAEDRRTLWQERDSLPGRTIKYRYFAGGVKDKPRFPVFLGFREGADLPEVV